MRVTITLQRFACAHLVVEQVAEMFAAITCSQAGFTNRVWTSSVLKVPEGKTVSCAGMPRDRVTFDVESRLPLIMTCSLFDSDGHQRKLLLKGFKMALSSAAAAGRGLYGVIDAISNHARKADAMGSGSYLIDLKEGVADAARSWTIEPDGRGARGSAALSVEFAE